MNNFIQKYEILLKNLKELQIDSQCFIQIRKPKLSNIELIAMNLTAEYMSIDSECQLFRAISGSYLDCLIDRSVYNRRKQKLFSLIERIRQNLASSFNEYENYFVVDSMPLEPLEVCKTARASEVRYARRRNFVFLIRTFVLLKTSIIMVTNFMEFVLYLVCFKVLI